MGANILEFNGVVHSVVGDVPVDSEAPVPAQSSKMLIGIEFASYVYS